MKILAPDAIRLLGLVMGLSCSLSVGAGNTATQRITYSVQEATRISVSGDPAPMVVVAATPGAEPISVTEASTRYSIASNAGENSKKITASLDRDLPAGVLLEVELAPPDANATSTKRALSRQATDLVTNIDNVAATDKAITYTLRAGATAQGLAGDSLLVTYTVTNQI